MITLYSKNNCPKCVELKKELIKESINHIVVMVDENHAALDFLKNAGHKSVPQMYSQDASGKYTHLGNTLKHAKGNT